MMPGKKFIGDIILVDIRHILNGLPADTPGRDNLDVVEPGIGIKPLPGRLFAQPGNPGRPRVIGSKGKEPPVERINAGVAEIAVHQEAQVLGAGVDVVFQLLDIPDPDIGIGGGRRQDLHNTDGPGPAPFRMIKP